MGCIYIYIYTVRLRGTGKRALGHPRVRPGSLRERRGGHHHGMITITITITITDPAKHDGRPSPGRRLLPTTADLRTPTAATSTTYDGRPGRLSSTQPHSDPLSFHRRHSHEHQLPPYPQHEACPARRPPGTAVERGEMLLGRERPRAVSAAPAGVAPCRCPLVRHSTRAYSERWRARKGGRVCQLLLVSY